MARKYDLISELYDRTCKTVVANSESWQAFLRSACMNYKLRFDEQLLVYAQRPDATAVLEIERWNNNFVRWVNRGARGIAVFADENRECQRLKHYFDISDTHESRHSRPVPIWKMKDEYSADVIDTLENTFGTLKSKENLAAAVISAAENATEDNLQDYLSEFMKCGEGSDLQYLSAEEAGKLYEHLVTGSVAFMIMSRLGINTAEIFESDFFDGAVHFNTQETLNALGFATSDIAEMGLTEISKTVMALSKQNRIIAQNKNSDYNRAEENDERSFDNEQNHIHGTGRLQSAESDIAGTADGNAGQIRTDAQEVSERTPQGDVLQSADEMHTDSTSIGSRAESDRDGGNAGASDGGEAGSEREAESGGYDELGSKDEQYQELGTGDSEGGSNLRLDYYDREHEDKSLPLFGRDDTIREILGTTPHLKASKDEIRSFFENNHDNADRTEYIKNIFNNDYTEVILSDDRRVGYKTYQNVLQLWEGSYLSRTKQSFYDWSVIAQHFEAMRLLGELQDTMKPLPSIDGQMSFMGLAEEEKSSAFSFSQEIIDTVLCRGSGVSEGKMRIYEQFQKSLSAKENAEFLKINNGWAVLIRSLSVPGLTKSTTEKVFAYQGDLLLTLRILI